MCDPVVLEELEKEMLSSHILSNLKQTHTHTHTHTQGVDNSRRLTGHHETAHIDQFFWGVAHRGASIRIPRGVAQGIYAIMCTL